MESFHPTAVGAGQPEGYGPDDRVPEGLCAFMLVLGILAVLGLVVVVALFIDVKVQEHGFQQDTQRNKAAASSQASASVATYYRDLLDAAKSAVAMSSRPAHRWSRTEASS